MQKVFEPVPKPIKDASETLAKTMTEASKKNKALANIKDKLLEIMNDRVIIATYLLSSLSKITNPEHTSLFKLVNDPDSKRLVDRSINKTMPVTP